MGALKKLESENLQEDFGLAKDSGTIDFTRDDQHNDGLFQQEKTDDWNDDAGRNFFKGVMISIILSVPVWLIIIYVIRRMFISAD